MLFALLHRKVESRSFLDSCAFPIFILFNSFSSTLELKTVPGKSLMKLRKIRAQILSPEVRPMCPVNSSIFDFQFSRIEVCRLDKSFKS